MLVILEHCPMRFFSSHPQFNPSRPPVVGSTHANAPYLSAFFQSRSLLNDCTPGFSRNVWLFPIHAYSIQCLIMVSASHGISHHGIGYGTRRLELACKFLTYEWTYITSNCFFKRQLGVPWRHTNVAHLKSGWWMWCLQPQGSTPHSRPSPSPENMKKSHMPSTIWFWWEDRYYR